MLHVAMFGSVEDVCNGRHVLAVGRKKMSINIAHLKLILGSRCARRDALSFKYPPRMHEVSCILKSLLEI